MSPPPDISVCIANYNGGAYVLECLVSVYSQQGDFHMEVILHDDCSNDDSLARIRREFPDIIVLNSVVNVGFCISNNRMVEASHGRYVLLLNNDAVLRPDSLQTLLSYADVGHEDCILGLPQHTLVDGALVDRGYGTDIFLNPNPILTPGTHEVGVATGACLWIPRDVWSSIGGFPDWFESIAEDIYLCLAGRLLGYRVIVLDAPGFDHWIGKNLGGGKVVAQRLSTTVRRRALSERNKTYVMLLCYSWPVLILVLPVHTLLLLVEALFLLASGAGWDKIRKIYAEIPRALWKHRKVLSARRTYLMSRRRSTLKQLFSQTCWFPQKLRLLLRHGKPELK
ncbi:MAG TPA: glycosyltransferase family 2 protein [Rhodanobacter sp.]|nr:glycosyltransferase family 2 protein [Rhodanobacter sp.]